VKGSDGEKEEDADAAAASPYTVAPEEAPSTYRCGSERSVNSFGGAEDSKGSDGEKEKDGDAAAVSSGAVAPAGVPSVYSCDGAEERNACYGGAAAKFAHAVTPVGAPSTAAAGLYGEWRGYSKSGSCRFRKDQVTRRDSVAKHATFDNWRVSQR
jgi:hypothetical protein